MMVYPRLVLLKRIALTCSIMLIMLLGLVGCGSESTATINPSPTAAETTSITTVTTLNRATTLITGTTAVSSATTALPLPSTNPTTTNTPATGSRPPILMKDFIGVNQDYRLYQDGTEKEFARVSKWLRDYAKWFCLEPDENKYSGVDGTGGCGTSPYFFNYNAFYTNLQAAGVNVLHVAELTPGYANWTGKSGDFPPVQAEGLGQKPDDFIKHAQYLYQIAAMYGNNRLNLPDQKTGQKFINAIENWNEPDGWWKGKGQFTKEQFYNMLLADYNGDEGRLPKAGVKQADPSLKFVMGGLATQDLSYLYGILALANQNGKKFPADVLNFHEYATDGKIGITPEQAGFDHNMTRAVKWRDSYVPGSEIWVSEFGWDTFAKGNEHSRIYAGEQNQANWILRSLVLYRAAGVDKAFVFIYNDNEADDPDVYGSSGLVALGNNKKPAYYYLGTMQDMIGDMYLERPIPTGQEEEVQAYLFRNPKGSNGVFTVWKTSGNGSKLDNFSLALPAGVSKNCTAVVPNNTSFNPTRTPLTVVNGKISLTVSETMTFVVCDNVGEIGQVPVSGSLANQTTPEIGLNGRILLSTNNLIEASPKAPDPESTVPLSTLVDEQKINPDDPQSPAPSTNWYALTPESSFALDLTRDFNLGRLDWFNGGGEGSGFEVYFAPSGAYGKWQPLTSIRNKGNQYGQWMSVQLTLTNKVQYLYFVPKGNTAEAKLGEIALYKQGATPLVQNKPIMNSTSLAATQSTTLAAAQATISVTTAVVAVGFTPLGIPSPSNGSPLATAVPAEGRLAIVEAVAQGGGNLKAAFDGKTDTDWRVAGKPDYAQFVLALDGIHTIDYIRYFVTGTDHAPNTTIQYSTDGQNWSIFKEGNGINTGVEYGWNTFKADGVKAHYLRFILKNMPDATGNKLYELGFYGEVQVIGS